MLTGVAEAFLASNSEVQLPAVGLKGQMERSSWNPESCVPTEVVGMQPQPSRRGARDNNPISPALCFPTGRSSWQNLLWLGSQEVSLGNTRAGEKGTQVDLWANESSPAKPLGLIPISIPFSSPKI